MEAGSPESPLCGHTCLLLRTHKSIILSLIKLEIFIKARRIFL